MLTFELISFREEHLMLTVSDGAFFILYLEMFDLVHALLFIDNFFFSKKMTIKQFVSIFR